jgi:hypothetical protein
MKDDRTPRLDYERPPNGIPDAVRSDAKFYAGMSFFVAFLFAGFAILPLGVKRPWEDVAAIATFLFASIAAVITYRLTIWRHRRNGRGQV